MVRGKGPQQDEILDAGAEIRAEILLEIRDPKSQVILFSDYFRKIMEFISRELPMCDLVQPRTTMCWSCPGLVSRSQTLRRRALKIISARYRSGRL